jgi:hypothetical protein
MKVGVFPLKGPTLGNLRTDKKGNMTGVEGGQEQETGEEAKLLADAKIKRRKYHVQVSCNIQKKT